MPAQVGDDIIILLPTSIRTRGKLITRHPNGSVTVLTAKSYQGHTLHHAEAMVIYRITEPAPQPPSLGTSYPSNMSLEDIVNEKGE